MSAPAEAASDGALLEVEHVWCTYGGARGSTAVVKDVSFAIAPVQTLGIV